METKSYCRGSLATLSTAYIIHFHLLFKLKTISFYFLLRYILLGIIDTMSYLNTRIHFSRLFFFRFFFGLTAIFIFCFEFTTLFFSSTKTSNCEFFASIYTSTHSTEAYNVWSACTVRGLSIDELYRITNQPATHFPQFWFACIILVHTVHAMTNSVHQLQR